MIHDTEHPLAGCNVDTKYGIRFHLQDWYDRVHGVSWKHSGHDLAISYTVRQSRQNLPDDDNVVYGRYEDGTEHLVHMTELEDFASWS